MMLLSDDERAYFMEMESLFNHPGWARLCREMQHEIDTVPMVAFDNAKTWDELLKARARVQALRELMTYDKAVDLRRLNIEQERLSAIEEVSSHEQTDQL